MLKELELRELDAPEIGGKVIVELPGDVLDGATFIEATWLGTVSNGRELAEACKLMQAICAERAECKEVYRDEDILRE